MVLTSRLRHCSPSVPFDISFLPVGSVHVMTGVDPFSFSGHPRYLSSTHPLSPTQGGWHLCDQPVWTPSGTASNWGPIWEMSYRPCRGHLGWVLTTDSIGRPQGGIRPRFGARLDQAWAMRREPVETSPRTSASLPLSFLWTAATPPPPPPPQEPGPRPQMDSGTALAARPLQKPASGQKLALSFWAPASGPGGQSLPSGFMSEEDHFHIQCGLRGMGSRAR